MIQNPAIKITTPIGKPSRVPLTTADGAALLLEASIKTVYDRADGGDRAGNALQWVWDIKTNPKGKIRELRFWVPELKNPQATARLTLDEVITEILPETRREFHAGEVCRFLQLRAPTLMLLRGELDGEVRRNSGYFPRPGLVKFFRSRWLGAAISNAVKTPTDQTKI